MAKTAMDKTAYYRTLPAVDMDKSLFPDEKKYLSDQEKRKNITL